MVGRGSCRAVSSPVGRALRCAPPGWTLDGSQRSASPTGPGKPLSGSWPQRASNLSRFFSFHESFPPEFRLQAVRVRRNLPRPRKRGTLAGSWPQLVSKIEVFPSHEPCPLIPSASPGVGEGACRVVTVVCKVGTHSTASPNLDPVRSSPIRSDWVSQAEPRRGTKSAKTWRFCASCASCAFSRLSRCPPPVHGPGRLRAGGTVRHVAGKRKMASHESAYGVRRAEPRHFRANRARVWQDTESLHCLIPRSLSSAMPYQETLLGQFTKIALECALWRVQNPDQLG
jgi:hypothetical protein